MGDDWRFLAQRIVPGQHPDEWPFIDTDLPLTNVQLTDVLTGPSQISGQIDPVYRRLKADDGRPVLEEWGTCLWAEASGQIAGGGIYTSGAFDGPRWSLTGAGFAAYPKGMGYEGEISFVRADPLSIVRHIWDHLQAGQDSNLGLIVDDSTTTPVRVGSPGRASTATTVGEPPPGTKAAQAIADRMDSGEPMFEDWTWDHAPDYVRENVGALRFEWDRDGRPDARTWLRQFAADHPADVTSPDPDGNEGPIELTSWSTDDLGAVIDDLARTTPFDYRERHRWNGTRTAIRHELLFGYPRLGRRLEQLRFVVGENVHTTPTVTGGGVGFANHVRFLGAGEGRDMVRREARLSDGRLRRMATVDDKSVLYPEHAQRRAREELTRRQPLLTVADVVVRDHPNAPLGSVEPGDEIRLQGELDWVDIDLWMRVLSVTITPDAPEVAAMSLLRADLA